MLSSDAQRPPGRAATTVPSPASEDTADRSDDHRRRADVASADNYSAARLAEHLAHAKFSAPKINGAVNFTLRADPEVAAEDLKAAVGGRAAAYRWAVALIAEVGR